MANIKDDIRSFLTFKTTYNIAKELFYKHFSEFDNEFRTEIFKCLGINVFRKKIYANKETKQIKADFVEYITDLVSRISIHETKSKVKSDRLVATYGNNTYKLVQIDPACYLMVTLAMSRTFSNESNLHNAIINSYFNLFKKMDFRMKISFLKEYYSEKKINESLFSKELNIDDKEKEFQSFVSENPLSLMELSCCNEFFANLIDIKKLIDSIRQKEKDFNERCLAHVNQFESYNLSQSGFFSYNGDSILFSSILKLKNKHSFKLQINENLIDVDTLKKYDLSEYIFINCSDNKEKYKRVECLEELGYQNNYPKIESRLKKCMNVVGMLPFLDYNTSLFIVRNFSATILMSDCFAQYIITIVDEDGIISQKDFDMAIISFVT